ncbi:MAG: hypothetical protein NTW87_07775 [Planctomycetota bacterium]|nr:hypothetical protein [Planctomycetota bacterium]
MHKEQAEQYSGRITEFQLELDKLRSVLRQENDDLSPTDRKRFAYVSALKAVDHANERLGELLQTLREFV